MHYLSRNVGLLMLGMSLSSCATANNAPSQTTVEEQVKQAASDAEKSANFSAALDRHIKAIQTRNLAEIEATITKGEELELIFPSGKRSNTRAAYVDFHRKWFADNSWRMTFKHTSMNVSEDLAYALYETSYTDSAEDGSESTNHAWLHFIFRLESGEWRLVHDQNTAIKAPVPR